MTDQFAALSDQLARAVDLAAASIVQVHGHRRPAAGVVFDQDLIVAPAEALDHDAVSVRLPNGNALDGAVLGRAFSMGIAVVRVPNLGLSPMVEAPDARVGHLAIAIGRTSSGGVMATLTNIAVIGGPLRTGRSSEIERVIRIAQPPHGALTGGALVNGVGQAIGIITASAIRGTTVVLPAALAIGIAQHLVKHGGAQQGFLGVSSSAVALPAHQRAGRDQKYGLLITAVVDGSPAASAGILVGDVVVAFDSQTVQDPETLVTLLRGDKVGKPVAVTVIRGGEVRDLQVTAGERPRRGEGGGR